MNAIIIIVALLFYVPSITYLIWKRHSWIDILAFGFILLILANLLNEFFPPWGTIGFVLVHLILTFLGIRGVIIAKRIGNLKNTASNHGLESTGAPLRGSPETHP